MPVCDNALRGSSKPPGGTGIRCSESPPHTSTVLNCIIPKNHKGATAHRFFISHIAPRLSGTAGGCRSCAFLICRSRAKEGTIVFRFYKTATGKGTQLAARLEESSAATPTLPIRHNPVSNPTPCLPKIGNLVTRKITHYIRRTTDLLSSSTTPGFTSKFWKRNRLIKYSIIEAHAANMLYNIG